MSEMNSEGKVEPIIGVWVDLKDQAPPEKTNLLYWWNNNWWPGQYYGEEDGLHIFAGKHGVLSGDVTHWFIPPEGPKT